MRAEHLEDVAGRAGSMGSSVRQAPGSSGSRILRHTHGEAQPGRHHGDVAGATRRYPSSVCMSRVPRCGTIRRWPSLLTKASRRMSASKAYTCTARPSFSVASPWPPMVLRPPTKVTSLAASEGSGPHVCESGVKHTFALDGRKHDSTWGWLSRAARRPCTTPGLRGTSTWGQERTGRLVSDTAVERGGGGEEGGHGSRHTYTLDAVSLDEMNEVPLRCSG